MKCVNCGTELEDNQKFCQKCGTSVMNNSNIQSNINQNTNSNVNNVSYENSNNYNYNNNNSNNSKTDKSSSKKKKIIIGIVIFVVVLIATINIIVISIFNSFKNKALSTVEDIGNTIYNVANDINQEIEKELVTEIEWKTPFLKLDLSFAISKIKIHVYLDTLSMHGF